MGFGDLAGSQQSPTQAQHLIAFSLAVSDVTGDGQGLFVESDGPFDLPQGVAGVAQATEKPPLSLTWNHVALTFTIETAP